MEMAGGRMRNNNKGSALTSMAGVTIALCWSAQACNAAGDNSDKCNCPGTSASVTIDPPCNSNGALSTTGVGCTVLQSGSGSQMVATDTAGTCDVTWTAADGASFTANVVFTSAWVPCGSDPHGCGQAAVAVQSVVQIGSACGDSGSDVGPSD
jgi:hypothetical protein